MSEPKKRPKKPKPEDDGKADEKLNVFFRLEGPEREALEKFIADQLIPPSPPQVAVGALIDFLTRHGYLPPKSSSAGGKSG